jgi:hypothetical protein
MNEPKGKKTTICRYLVLTERFEWPAMISCADDETNHSLLATKNYSQFHHSFDRPFAL